MKILATIYILPFLLIGWLLGALVLTPLVGLWRAAKAGNLAFARTVYPPRPPWGVEKKRRTLRDMPMLETALRLAEAVAAVHAEQAKRRKH